MAIDFNNLLTPPLLFFVLGVTAGFFKSDLDIPKEIASCLSIYLMTAIGFKGGLSLANTPLNDSDILVVVIAGTISSFALPFLGYWLLKITSKLDKSTAAAVAAHYGSVSLVTFLTAITFLDFRDIPYSSYMIAVLAFMEAPAILAGLIIAKNSNSINLHYLLQQIIRSGSVLLLLGSLLIGFLCPKHAVDELQGFFITPFHGMLCFFLLEMGLFLSKEFTHLKKFSIELLAFAIYMPLIGATIGLAVGKLADLNVGTITLLMTLFASASYIAVSAAMRNNLPEAKASIYVPMTLAITFPFNILLGIPLYFFVASYFA